MTRLEPSEKQIQAAVIEHWLRLGVPGSLVAAVPNAWAHGQPGLTKGLSDLLCIAPGFGVGLLELKKRGGRVSMHQQWFGDLLEGAGVPNAIAWGRDEPISILENWGIVHKPNWRMNAIEVRLG